MNNRIDFGDTIQKTGLLIFILLMNLFSLAQASDEVMPEPQAIVKAASDKMMQALKTHKQELEADPDRIYGLVVDILLPHFDFRKMAKLALGKNWRKATAEQRDKFVKEFRGLIIRTYSTAMLEYTNQKIDFLPFKGNLAKKKVRIKMSIIQPNGPSIPMDLAMYQNKQGEWKVYDVRIDGVSLVTNYRSTFATKIRNGGLDKLIDELASRNIKVKV